MKLSMKSIFIFTISVTFCTFLLVGYLDYQELSKTKETREQALYTQVVIIQLNELHGACTDCKSKYRSYLLTGDTSYFIAYINHLTDVKQRIAALENLTVDNNEQQQLLASLSQLVSTKYPAFKNLTKPIKRFNYLTTRKLLLSSNDDAIRSIISRVIGIEKQLLGARMRILENDNQLLHKLTLLSLVLGAGFFFSSILAIMKLITERRKTEIEREKALADVEHSEAKFKQLIEASPGGIVMTDQFGKIVLVNSQIEKLFGYSRSELSGQPVEIFVPEEFRAKHTQYVSEFVKHPVERPIGTYLDLHGQHKNGTKIPVDISLALLSQNHDHFILASIIDITERKEAEKRVSEFYSAMSHELRTPLTSIGGALELLVTEQVGRLSAKTTELVNVAYVESQRLIRLVNDILDIRKIEAGKLELNSKKSLISTLINQTLDEIRNMEANFNVSIVKQICDDLEITCDEDRFIQVLTNLLSNAIKFSPAGSEVTIMEKITEPNVVRISVIDNGLGIPSNLQHKLFGKFQQLNQVGSRSKGGTGLGLAISKAIVEQHKGRIGVESEEGKGSTFWFELPLQQI